MSFSGGECLDSTPKVWSTKEKTGKLDFTKKYVSVWDIIRKTKWQINWEKIFGKHMFDKELVSNTYKEFLKLDNKKTNNPTFNDGEKFGMHTRIGT